MKHARKDYNRIQDPENKIPEDEPVFLLRGQDRHAPLAVRYYYELLRDDKEVDPEMVEIVKNWAAVMQSWPKKKVPDIN